MGKLGCCVFATKQIYFDYVYEYSFISGTGKLHPLSINVLALLILLSLNTKYYMK